MNLPSRVRSFLKKLFRINTSSFLISRQKFKTSLRCEKLFWEQSKNNLSNAHYLELLQYKDLIQLNRKLYPDAIELKSYKSNYSFTKTLEALKNRKPTFNTHFQVEDLNSKTDLLVPSEKENFWNIIEIKFSTNIKRLAYYDIAFQKYVIELSGFKIDTCIIKTINPNYLFVDNNIEPEQFYKNTDVTKRIEGIFQSIPGKLERLKAIYKSTKSPQNRGCKNPTKCIYPNVCWDNLQDSDIFQLREGKDLSYDLYTNQGIHYITDIPQDVELSDIQKLQFEAHKTKSPYINHEMIAQFIEKIKFPVYFLDFETINPPLPIFINSKPFQHVPFQYSLHILQSPDSEPVHHQYICEMDNNNPRIEILDNLRKLIYPEGTILCFNDAFEKKCLKEAVAFHKEFEPWYKSILPMFLDLAIPFKYFYYYHPEQKGKASLKAILPVMTDESYKNLKIQDGHGANQEYLRIRSGKSSFLETEKVKKRLLLYCKMDTYALFLVMRELRKLCLKTKED